MHVAGATVVMEGKTRGEIGVFRVCDANGTNMGTQGYEGSLWVHKHLAVMHLLGHIESLGTTVYLDVYAWGSSRVETTERLH